MAYITLNELKEILPIILERWIDEDDEDWERIFKEIEQKCHIGTKRKGKKWKKYVEDDIYELKSIVDTLSTVFSGHGNEINELTKKVNGLNKEQLGMHEDLIKVRNDITAAKSMAETAKRRTDVDYTKPSNKTSYVLWSNAREIINVCRRSGATKEEVEQLDLILSKYLQIKHETWKKVEDNGS